MSVDRKSLYALGWLARLGIAGLFLYAGLLKIGEPTQFASDIANYRLLPEAVIPWLATFMPVFEVVVALALLTGSYVRAGALLSAAMLALFAGAMAQAKLRGIDLDCGCFGADNHTQVSWIKVAQNLALATLAVWVAWSARHAPVVAPQRQAS